MANIRYRSRGSDERSIIFEAAQRSPFKDAASETEIGSVVKHDYGERAAKIGGDSERIISSVALFTSKSIKELEGINIRIQRIKEVPQIGD